MALTRSTKSKFRSMLAELSRNITDCELESVVFLCSDNITRRRLEEVKNNSLHLWQALEERCLISPTDVHFLKEYLLRPENCGTGLINIVESYERDLQTLGDGDTEDSNVMTHHAGECYSSVGLSLEIDLLAQRLGHNWRMFARRLGLDDGDIDDVTCQCHVGDLPSQVRQAMRIWVGHQGSGARRDVLVAALRRCELNRLATELHSLQ